MAVDQRQASGNPQPQQIIILYSQIPITLHRA